MIPKPFQGLRTFCKAGLDTNKHYAILGLPTDVGTSNRAGARHGPAAIRDASVMLTDGAHMQFGVNPTPYLVDLGDADLSAGSIDLMLEQVEMVAFNTYSWGKHPVFLGGDHTVTLGILRAIKKVYGKVAVVHFDAHCDTWNTNFDLPIGHGTWLYNAIEERLVDSTKVISIGVRSPTDEKSSTYLDRNGGTTFTARYGHSNMQAVISNALHLIGDTPVYLTFDIDALDPAYAPGTGTPEVGGLSSMWVLECLEQLQDLNWIGMDIVEVAPAYDHSDITSLAAATIAWTYLCMIIAKSNTQPEAYDCGDSADDNEDFTPPIPSYVPQGPTGF